MFSEPISIIDESYPGLGQVIESLRNKTMKVTPGYDGVYGVPQIGKAKDKIIAEPKKSQKQVVDF